MVIWVVELQKTTLFTDFTNCSYSLFLSSMIFAPCEYPSLLVGKCKVIYIPSTINIWKKVFTKAIWADKKGLVSGRLACTSSKTEILIKIGI